jgi:hypothetical protein
MPYVAVQAHRLLGDLAAVRMAVHLLEDPGLSDEHRARTREALASRLDAMEEVLHQLITAPRGDEATTT